MKTKNIIYTIIITMLIVACEDVLDKQPLDALADTNFWQTPDNAQTGLIGCYDALQHKEQEANALYDMWGARDVLTPIGMSRRDEYNVIAEGAADPNNTLFTGTWAGLYLGVVRCNDLLDHIDDIDFLGDEQQKKIITGQALFLRALFYYALVDYWGDVPLILHIQTISESLVERDPKEEVINAMINDLEFAIENLPESYNAINRGRATKGAALALDVKFKMLKKDWAGAAASAEQVLNLGYTLQPNFPDIFRLDNENNSEVIFDIQFVGGEIGEGNNFDKWYNNRSTATNGWSTFNPSTYLVDMYEIIDENPSYTVEKKIDKSVYEYFEGRDPRMEWTIIRPGSYLIDSDLKTIYYPYQVRSYSMSMTGMCIRKNILEGADGKAWDSPNNWIVFRLADIMLNYAEAKLQATVGAGSIVGDATIYEMLNTIRQRASLKLPTYEPGSLTKEQMLENIYKERIRELAFEGWLYTDFRRWGWIAQNSGFKLYGMNITSSKTTLGTEPNQTRNYQPYMDLWAIPQSEREVNPNLSQNDGYPE